MTLQFARQLALAALEATINKIGSASAKESYIEALALVKADFESTASTKDMVQGALDRTLWNTVCDALEIPVTSTLGRIKSAIRTLKSGKSAPQSQDSTLDQLRRSITVLNQAGLYDAADFVRSTVDAQERHFAGIDKSR